MKGCKTAPPNPARRGRETEKQPFYLSFVFSLPSTPQHPLLSAQVFFFSFYHREDFSSFLSLSLGSTLLLEFKSLEGFFPSLFSSFFSSFFLLSYFSKRVLFAVGVSFENQVTPFFPSFLSLSFLSSAEKGNKD